MKKVYVLERMGLVPNLNHMVVGDCRSLSLQVQDVLMAEKLKADNLTTSMVMVYPTQEQLLVK